MSEKRFSWIAEKTGQHYEISIRDGDIEYTISDDFFKSKDVVAVIVDLLNKQQFKITELEIELVDCKNRKEQSEYNLHKKIRELKKIPKSIREVWIDEQDTEEET